MRLQILDPFIIVLRIQMHIIKSQILQQIVIFILIDLLDIQVKNMT